MAYHKTWSVIKIRHFFLTIGFFTLHLIKSSSQLERQKYLTIKILNAKFFIPNSKFLISYSKYRNNVYFQINNIHNPLTDEK